MPVSSLSGTFHVRHCFTLKMEAIQSFEASRSTFKSSVAFRSMYLKKFRRIPNACIVTVRQFSRKAQLYPEDGGTTIFRSVWNYFASNTVSHYRRRESPGRPMPDPRVFIWRHLLRHIIYWEDERACK